MSIKLFTNEELLSLSKIDMLNELVKKELHIQMNLNPYLQLNIIAWKIASVRPLKRELILEEIITKKIPKLNIKKLKKNY